MTSVTQLYARAILLKEYRDGKKLEQAMEKVEAELGPKVINGDHGRKWFEAFQSGHGNIANTAHAVDRRLIENGTFLRTKRSWVCALQPIEDGSICTTYSADGRFQIVDVFDQETTWMVDTFNKTKKKIHVDLSPINDLMELRCFVVETMCFIEDSKIYGVFFNCINKKRVWFTGNFDERNVVLRIDTVKNLEDLRFTLNTQTQPPSLTGFSESQFYSYTVDLANGNLSEVNVIDMHDNLWSPMIRNGKLFGFSYDPNMSINTKKLFEISLVDGSKIEHEVEDKNNIKIKNSQISFLWTNDELLVGLYDWNNKVSTVFKLDISQMKWENTKIEVEGQIESMTLFNGMLIVLAFGWRDSLYRIYRFQYDGVDSLANLIWLSMRRYSKRNTSFRGWFISKIPKNYKLRPLWNNRKRKHDSSD